MAFSNEDKIIIQNDYEKKKQFGLQYLENHPAKKWNYSSVKRLLKKSREISSMDERHGSGRPNNNMDFIE